MPASTGIGAGTTGGTGSRRFSLWVLLLIAGAFAFSDDCGYSTFFKARGADGVGDGQLCSLLLGAAFYFARLGGDGQARRGAHLCALAPALMPLAANAVAAKVVPEQAKREEYSLAAERAG